MGVVINVVWVGLGLVVWFVECLVWFVVFLVF